MPWYWPSVGQLANVMPQPVHGVNLVTGSSFPITLVELDDVTAMIEGEFHSAAAEGGYAFPIGTGASVAFNFAKKVVSDGVQAYVLTRVGGQSSTAAAMQAAYDKALKAIAEGDVPLLGAPDLAEGGAGNVRGRGVASPWITSTWMP